MRALIKLVGRWRHQHEWAYAKGKMPGLYTGEPRDLCFRRCFRRCCVICGLREEILRYERIHKTSDGTEWMA